MKCDFTSGFARDLENMIALKCSLGYSESTYQKRANRFDRYCAEAYPDHDELTQTLVLSWLKPEPEESSQTIHGKAAFVRALGKYQKSIGKAAYILPERFTAGGTVFIPYLFSDDELAALFHEIDSYQYPKDPFRPVLFSTYFRMTYTCGLRPNEGRNLKRNEVDLNSGEMRIIETRRHKSRTIVMSEDMFSLARGYASIRDAAFPESVYFFPSPDGEPYFKDETWFSPEWLFYVERKGIRSAMCDDTARLRIQKYAELARENCPDVPERVHPHLWRHTRAIHLYQHGMDLTLISQWFGHKQVETTLIYAYADTEAKRKAIENAMGAGSLGTKTGNYTVEDEETLKWLYGL